MTTPTTSTPLFEPQRFAAAEVEAHARAIEALGYTAREARFLVKAISAGGYFLRRHVATAFGVARGGSDAALIDRLTANRHVTRYGFCRAEQVWHLCAAGLYPEQEYASPRATRPRPALTIARRLIALDAVLQQSHCRFLAGHTSRITLCERAGIPAAALPSRTYRPAGASRTVTRALPDLPLLGCDTAAATPVLVAGYVADPLETPAGFTTFVTRHAGLFREHGAWRVLFICTTARQADQARRVFDRQMSADIRAGAARLEDLAREYGELRRIYDAQLWHQLDTTRIRRLFELKQRLGADADRIYAAWSRRQGTADHDRPLGLMATPRTVFEPLVLAHRYTALEPIRGLR